MLSDRVRILDFDGSLMKQQRLIERYRPDIVDLTGVGPQCRLWVGGKAAGVIAAALQPEAKHAVTFLGSGDFHHASSLLLRQFSEPLTLIVFDFHPDWDILPPRFGCGSWVSRALEQAAINKVLLLGVSSDDLASPAIHTGNLQALQDDRLEIYPYCHGPTRIFLRSVPDNHSLKVERWWLSSTVFWSELQGRDLREFMEKTLQRCGVKHAYVSIDKDCLRRDHALTNWEEGRLSLDELLQMLGVIKESMDIVGLDITGEYSAPVVAGRLKRICSRLDHPADYIARAKPAESIDAVNEETNLRILECCLGK